MGVCMQRDTYEGCMRNGSLMVAGNSVVGGYFFIVSFVLLVLFYL